MMPARQPLELRLALRVEGEWWVAYAALTGTMDGAIELARIRMTIVTGPQGFARKQAFMALTRDALAAEIAAVTGATPIWPDADGVPAPEHERAGRA